MRSVLIALALLLSFCTSASAGPGSVIVGKITAVAGKSSVIHLDKSHVPAKVDASVYQGDVIETSKTGAVNIQFTDNTMFAVSENARLSVDQFAYDASKDSGRSIFSMLRGVFVYTSGLIGKKDPSKVRIETPVASLGIRGTVIAGHINPKGHESQITLLDGAITVTNGSGTEDMNSEFDTVSITSYNDQPKDLGEMDPDKFVDAYHSLTTVAFDTLDNFVDIGDTPEKGQDHQGGTERPDVPDTFERPEIPEPPPETPNLEIGPHGQ